MPNVTFGKEKTVHVPLESQALDLAEAKDIAPESLPPHKVLKIFSINIIAQGLPFCRRRVSIARHRPATQFGFSLMADRKMSKFIVHACPFSPLRLLLCSDDVL